MLIDPDACAYRIIGQTDTYKKTNRQDRQGFNSLKLRFSLNLLQNMISYIRVKKYDNRSRCINIQIFRMDIHMQKDKQTDRQGLSQGGKHMQVSEKLTLR